jgi:nucleotide-binding universal stress UspA family protein
VNSRILLALNTTLHEPGTLAPGVTWVKSADFGSKALEHSKNIISHFLEWVRINASNPLVTALYVVDKSLLDMVDFENHLRPNPQNLLPERKKKLLEALKEKAMRDGKRYLEEVLSLGKDRGVEINPKLRFGEPVREILREAKELKSQTILAGKKSRITSDIIKKSPCPVVVISHSPVKRTYRLRERLQRVFLRKA